MSYESNFGIMPSDDVDILQARMLLSMRCEFELRFNRPWHFEDYVNSLITGNSASIIREVQGRRNAL